MESPLRDWLTLQCQTITGVEAGLAVLGASERAPGATVAHWPSEEHLSPPLSATVEIARERGKVAAQEPTGAGDATGALSHLAVPVMRKGRVAGAVGVSVRGVAGAELKAIAELLHRGVRGLVLLLEAKGERDRLAALLSLASSLLDHDRLPQAAHALATEMALRLGCERVAVGLLRGSRMKVIALSTSLHFAEESDAARDLRCAMEEAADLDAVVELPAPSDAPPRALGAHEALLRSSGAEAICSIPLAARGRAVGAITCEWSQAGALAASLRRSARDAAVLAGPILELTVRAEASAIERTRARTARWLERHLGSDRSLAKVTAAVAAGLLLLLAIAPGNYRVSARASLEGRIQRVLVAAVAGYLSEANARPGDLVRAGDVLARLDDRDLRLERRKLASQRTQLEKEYREALAGEDRTRVSILSAQIEQAAAQLDLAEEQLGRTSVVAPFDGVVLEGDLEGSLGSPVERGSVLFELAPLDGYRIILEVDERDIAAVAEGQSGRLALSALPDRPLPLVVERITPIATAEEGRNYFRVEAVLEEPAPALRPGMEGIAKIDAGRRKLLWIWTHEMLDWIRLSTWSLMP